MSFFSLVPDEIRIVKDGQYGTENPEVKGGWDGIVGELVRQVSYISKSSHTKLIVNRYAFKY